MNVVSRASLAQGLSAMSVNPLRTTLSTLGVVMGIASVIATLALADGLEQYARSQVAAHTDVQSITVSSRTQDVREGFSFPNPTYPVFALRDAADLKGFLGAKGDVTMSIAGATVVTTSNAPAHAVSVTATLANFLLFGMRDVAVGRYFTDVEVVHNAPVVVLSYKLAAELSPDGDMETMIGRGVRVHGRTLTTIGVMPSYTGETAFQIFIPLRGAGPAGDRREEGARRATAGHSLSIPRRVRRYCECGDWARDRDGLYRGVLRRGVRSVASARRAASGRHHVIDDSDVDCVRGECGARVRNVPRASGREAVSNRCDQARIRRIK